MNIDKTGAWRGISAEQMEKMANEHGTPFYLYDADAINAKIGAVRNAFAGFAKVYYAVKANPNLALLRAVRATADGLDISSGGELEQALLAGYDGEQLSFAGPAKTMPELAAAIRAGVGCISIESRRELDECIEMARRTDTKANILLRVNPVLQIRAYGLKMGGKAVQFGIDEEELGATLEVVARHTGQLRFRGIHVYAGSQCFEPFGVIEGVRNTLRIAGEIERSSGFHCGVVNLGGGFGVAHSEDARELELAPVAAELGRVFQDFVSAPGGPREMVFELGRYLTADAGVYVARVVSSKRSRGKAFFVSDGGLHHHLTAAGTFGAAFRSNFALRNISRPNAARIRCSIAGPSCNPTDLLGVDVEIPEPQHGDLLAVLASGSYGYTASPLLFLGRDTPAELIHQGGVVTLARRRRSMVDFN